MITKLLNRFGTLAAMALLIAVPALTPVAASAATIQDSLCNSVDTLTVNGSGDCSSTGQGTETVNGIVATVVNMLSVLVGVVAVIMIIWGGMRYVTSGGDSGKVTTAKNTIIYALLGLVVVALSQFIVKFVLAKVTGQ